MNGILHTSSSPHIRDQISTRSVMLDVVLALMPCSIFGVYHFGLHALLILLVSTLAAVLSEYVFDRITRRRSTIGDYSAVVTGLMLGLCLSPTVPLYIPALGSMFAILVVKCAFGGLGQNFMNPALAGRCFLLISFSSAMSSYTVDAFTGATPLAALANGESVDLISMFLGFTNGTIGISAAAILLGGVYLLVCGTITWHIPLSYLVSFLAMMGFTAGQGFSLSFLTAHLCGGGLLLAVFFMATDPVTCPMRRSGQILYGVLLGALTALFRVHGNATESISYAVIIADLCVPLLDRLPLTRPFGLGVAQKKRAFPKSALILCLITLIAGAMLGGVHFITKDTIEAQKEANNNASYQAVVADATSFKPDSAAKAAIEALSGGFYGDGAYGKSAVNAAMTGYDGSTIVGYAISVTSNDAFEGSLTVSVGIDADGIVRGVVFTELNETPGMGMRCDEEAWRSQFIGRNVSAFKLIKFGSAAAEDEIDTVSGASTTSSAVVSAVNAALDFYRNYLVA